MSTDASQAACSAGQRDRTSSPVNPSQSPKSVSISPSTSSTGCPIASPIASAVCRARRSGELTTALTGAERTAPGGPARRPAVRRAPTAAGRCGRSSAARASGRSSRAAPGSAGSASPSGGVHCTGRFDGRRAQRRRTVAGRLALPVIHRPVGQMVGVLVRLARDPLERRHRRSRSAASRPRGPAAASPGA